MTHVWQTSHHYIDSVIELSLFARLTTDVVLFLTVGIPSFLIHTYKYLNCLLDLPSKRYLQHT